MRISDWSSDVCSSDLAGAGNVAALARGTRGSAALFELPGDDAVQDVGARIDAEDLDVEVDVGAGFAVDGLNLDLHDQDSCSPSLAAVSTTASSAGVSLVSSAGSCRLPFPTIFRPA